MAKPSKPSPDFPLFAHSNGQWAKKVKGRMRYFGPWDNPQAALECYLGNDTQASTGRQQLMSQQNSVADTPYLVKNRGKKPDKPYPGFPLFPHASGRWAKKIRGKTHFFGPWREPHQALTRYLTEKDNLESGHPVRASVTPSDALTVKKMVAAYLEAKKLSVECGDMAPRTWQEYKSYGARMIKVFGADAVVEQLGPTDFQRLRANLQKSHKSLFSLQSDIPKIKVYFSWAERQGYIDRQPRYGDAMARPSRAALERERSQQPRHVFTSNQIRKALTVADVNLKAMILLGINCGFGNTDCANLTVDKLDLNNGWSIAPRTKTGIKRRCPLWPETIDALKEAIQSQKVAHKQVFVTVFGKPYSPRNLSRELGKVFKKAKVESGDFYDLRRTCASIGIQVGDDDALRTIMGHRRMAADMLSVYNRLDVSDERLRAVTDFIHDWLFKGSVSRRASPRTDDDQQAARPSLAESPFAG